MEALTTDLADLLTDPVYSDLEIRCGSKSFHVHRAVVYARSKVLAAECHVGFQEGAKQIIEHTMFDAATMDCLVQFLYRGDYKTTRAGTSGALVAHPSTESVSANSTLPATDQQQPTAVDALLSHVRACAIADFYELPELQVLAVKKFAQSSDGSQHLTPTELLEVISVVYEYANSGSTGLRDRIWCVAMDDASDLASNTVFVEQIVQRENLKNFVLDFIQGLAITTEARVVQKDRTHQDAVTRLQSQLARVKEEGEEHARELVETNTDLRDQLEKARAENAELKAQSDELRNGREAAITDCEAKDQQVLDLMNDLAETRKHARAEQFEAKREIAEAVMKQLEELRSIHRCWRCRKPFSYNLQRYGPFGYKARCAFCTAKHERGLI